MGLIKFNGWTIEHDKKPIPTTDFDYSFYHVNHDGAPDGVHLCGCGSSVEDCIEQIKEMEAEQ